VWDLEERLGLPEQVVLTRGADLIGRGLLDGCPCGCRGDYLVTARGRALLREATAAAS
jgi:hypothetical protein